MAWWLASLGAAVLLCLSEGRPNAALRVGAGIYDVTGPASSVNLMGYAMTEQTAAGIHQRLRARAFVFSTRPESSAPSPEGIFAFISMDIGMGASAVKNRALELLEAEPLTRGYFNDANLCMSGTHTHSAPAGFLTHTLFQVTSLGFVHQTYEVYANGTAHAVIRAFRKLTPARVRLAKGRVADANINRSPTAYLRNSEEERQRYAADGDTDKNMTLLRLEAESPDSTPIGMINWFSVHGTSMNLSNRLLSGDNKGYASYLFERRMNPGRPTGKGSFVGAFAATNLGDVSPNINGATCLDTGLPCDRIHSTCMSKSGKPRNELCRATGPGKDMFDSARIIGQRQEAAAQKLWDSAQEEIGSTIDYRHAWVNMRNLTFTSADGRTMSTCGPAMGYAFAAGTTDGHGMFNFQQTTNSTNTFWNVVSRFLASPSKKMIECQAPKPILLDLNDISVPYAWAAHTVPIQVLRLGRMFVLSVPSEFTTMAGRRLKEYVAREIHSTGLLPPSEQPELVIAGLSNEYADYTTTFEEYQEQRYEGASTVYGPNELEAFISQFRRLIGDMAAGRASRSDPEPSKEVDEMIELLPTHLLDSVPLGSHFGKVTQQPVGATFQAGERVSATFQSASPRNDLRTEGTFAAVELLSGDGNVWEEVANDGDWETQFRYHWESDITFQSKAEIIWDIPEDAAPGTYRLRHYGASKDALGKIKQFNGTSASFQVVSAVQVRHLRRPDVLV
eukprot:TRINITY_DN102915_c0_g1_i1.p1 TRINITY_DN102915_c0_g1~~TRINITY_DN102915_c0_g1_i1.p1  ORF type:complete len:732 (+),score=104.35 TRINITY_DN102915_c0_g1_i1:49-2244(+)